MHTPRAAGAPPPGPRRLQDGVVARAIPWPLAGAALGAVGTVALLGGDGALQALRASGWVGLFALASAVVAASVAGAAIAVAVPRVVPLAAAVAPWLVAAAGAWWALGVVEGVLDLVAPAERARLAMAGASEAFAARALVAPICAGLCAGVGAGALMRLRADGLRAAALAMLAFAAAALALGSALAALTLTEGLAALAHAPGGTALTGADAYAAIAPDAASMRFIGAGLAALAGLGLVAVVAMRPAAVGGAGVAACALVVALGTALDLVTEARLRALLLPREVAAAATGDATPGARAE